VSRRRGRGRRDGEAPTADRVLTGRRFVAEGLRAGTVREVLLDRAQESKLDDVRTEAERAGANVRLASREELDRVAQGTKHQGVVALAPPYPYRSLEDVLDGRPRLKASEASHRKARHAIGETAVRIHSGKVGGWDSPPETGAFLLALDEITDPHNLGAILRSAVAFRVDGVLIGKHRAAEITPVVVRASAGASEHARVVKVTNLQKTLATLAEREFQIVGLAGEADHGLKDLPAATRRVLVVGSEGKGLRRMVRERCTVLARIDGAGGFESLNASVATGVALHAMRT